MSPTSARILALGALFGGLLALAFPGTDDLGWLARPSSHRAAIRSSAIFFFLFVFHSIFLFRAMPAWGNGAGPEILRDVGFDQKLNEQVPLDLVFRDENGAPSQLKEYFGKRPVIMVLVYYECPNLCPLILDSLVRNLKALSFDVGKQFNVLTVSIDPGEGPELAKAKKEEYLKRYGRPGAEEGWDFLTGDEASIRQLTQAVGFRYTYDAKKDQYAHLAGIVILTPQGTVARYFYGIEYAPRDLRLGLVEASEGKIGSPVDQLLLFCYEYDPATGQYSLIVMNVLRLAGLVTVLSLGAFMCVMLRRERRNKLKAGEGRLEVPYG